jgi:hypothetical protein
MKLSINSASPPPHVILQGVSEVPLVEIGKWTEAYELLTYTESKIWYTKYNSYYLLPKDDRSGLPAYLNIKKLMG